MPKITRLPTAALRRVKNPDLEEPEQGVEEGDVAEPAIARAGRQPWFYDRWRKLYFETRTSTCCAARVLFALRRRRR